MGFTFLRTKRSAHSKKKGSKTNVEAGPLASYGTYIDHTFPFLNPLALNPPNRPYWTPKSKSQQGTIRTAVPGDLPVTFDLTDLIDRTESLAARTMPELNLGGQRSIERWRRTGRADEHPIDGKVIVEQARALARLRTQRNTLTRLPATSCQASIKSAAPEPPSANGDSAPRKSSFDHIIEESMRDIAAKDLPAKHGRDASNATQQQHHYDDDDNKTLTPPRSRNPSPERLARLDKRPVPLGYDLASPVSICPSLAEALPDDTCKLWFNAETLASLNGSAPAYEDQDIAEICEVTQLGMVHNGARVIDVSSVRNRCCSSSIFLPVRPLTVVQLAVSSDRPKFYSLPPTGTPRPDSPTLPPEFPAPFFSKRK